jgi:hypothetical protein
VAISAALNESDLGVDAFQPRVGQAELDGGDDRVEVFADAPDQGLVGGDTATERGGAPLLEVVCGVGRVDDAVEVAELFLEYPGAPQPVAAPTPDGDETTRAVAGSTPLSTASAWPSMAYPPTLTCRPSRTPSVRCLTRCEDLHFTLITGEIHVRPGVLPRISAERGQGG